MRCCCTKTSRPIRRRGTSSCSNWWRNRRPESKTHEVGGKDIALHYLYHWVTPVLPRCATGAGDVCIDARAQRRWAASASWTHPGPLVLRFVFGRFLVQPLDPSAPRSCDRTVNPQRLGPRSLAAGLPVKEHGVGFDAGNLSNMRGARAGVTMGQSGAGTIDSGHYPHGRNTSASGT